MWDSYTISFAAMAFCGVLSIKGDFAYQWRKRIPRKERDHETEPGKEENSAILIEWVEDRNRHGFPVGRVDLWRGVEDSEGTESHCGLRKRDVRFGIWNCRMLSMIIFEGFNTEWWLSNCV